MYVIQIYHPIHVAGAVRLAQPPHWRKPAAGQGRGSNPAGEGDSNPAGEVGSPAGEVGSLELVCNQGAVGRPSGLWSAAHCKLRGKYVAQSLSGAYVAQSLSGATHYIGIQGTDEGIIKQSSPYATVVMLIFTTPEQKAKDKNEKPKAL